MGFAQVSRDLLDGKEVRKVLMKVVVKMFILNPINLVGNTFLRVSPALRTPVSDLPPTTHSMCRRG